MKEAELRNLARCAVCRKLLGQTHSAGMFYRLRVEHFVLNGPAIQRQTGLEMLLGNCAAIAQAMGPDEDLAVSLRPERSVMVCQACAFEHPLTIGQIVFNREAVNK